MINLKNIQTEVDAGFLYKILGDNEADPNVASIFHHMSEIEKGHALAFMKKNNMDTARLLPPSKRALVLQLIGKVFGYDYVLGVLLDTEKSISSSIVTARQKGASSGSISDTAHVTILKNILKNNTNVSGSNLARFEKRHRSVGGNALRAAVLGGNDGLVSNFSLAMGMAGATNGSNIVLLTGLAGLLAGALKKSLTVVATAFASSSSFFSLSKRYRWLIITFLLSSSINGSSWKLLMLFLIDLLRIMSNCSGLSS
jgi:hypothetical protein